MKKRQMAIEEHKIAPGAHTITVSNARYQEGFPDAIEKIMKAFLADKEVFFGFCRTDGLNLTRKQQKKLEKEIPAFFQKNGNFQSLSEYLTAARTRLDDHSCRYIPLIFDYYLETIMFNPEVDWEIFKQYHSNYQEHRLDEMILDHFAEMLFYYFDSGDLLLCFNPQMYSPGEVRSVIERAFGV